MEDKVKCSFSEMVPIHKLVPHPKNPNEHPDDQIEMLSKIIDYQGMRSPIVVSRLSGFITKGHGRLAALKKLGWESAPIDYQDYQDEAQEYADIVADNAIAEWASLNLKQINEDFVELGPELDIEMLGIKDFEIEPIDKLEPQCDEDEVPEVKHEPVTKRGDIWLLGNHRVMCGDSTMIDDVEKLMNGEKADMVFTDPPYKLTGGGSKGTWGENLRGSYFDGNNYKDSKKENLFDVPEFKEWVNLFDFVLKESNEIFVMSNVRNTIGICSELLDAGYKFHNILVMNKDTAFPQKWYSTNTEFIFYMYKGKAIDPLKKCQSNVFNVKMPKGSEKKHVSQKPVEMISSIISNHPFGSVYEPFLGSGSTLIACEKTNRKCYGMELDEHYCDVIVERWQKYTGNEAVLESGESYNKLKEKLNATT